MTHKAELAAIVNINEDSFYEPSRYHEPIEAVTQATRFFGEPGVTMVDIGGESTRPNADPIPVEEEWRRIRSVVNELVPVYGQQISVDTYHPEIVLRIAKDIGAFTVNDVTRGNNPAMFEAAAAHNLQYIVSHLPHEVGQNIQAAHTAKPAESLEQVVDDSLMRAEQMVACGIHKSQIYLDPGIGFGKPLWLNWQLLEFPRHIGDYRSYIGFSNKSFLRTDPKNGHPIPGLEKPTDPTKHEQEADKEIMDSRNLFAARIAIESGVSMLRVHEPKLYSNFLT